MKKLLAIALVLVAAVVAFWLGFVRAPPPQVICQHKADILLAEASGQHDDAVANLLDQYRLGCTKNAENLLRLRGKLAYARHARCVIAATTTNDAERC
jgi:hypothetical protein